MNEKEIKEKDKHVCVKATCEECGNRMDIINLMIRTREEYRKEVEDAIDKRIEKAIEYKCNDCKSKKICIHFNSNGRNICCLTFDVLTNLKELKKELLKK